MFYTKNIEIMAESEPYRDEYGIWHEGELTTFKTIDCDIQPITKELAFKEFGTEEEVKYRVFCPINQINVATILKYDNKYFRVVSLMKWGNHIDLVMGDYDV